MNKKKQTYGGKAIRVLNLLNSRPELTNREIAKMVDCSINYVLVLRKKMVHVPPCPEEILDLTPEMEVELPGVNDIQMGGTHYKEMAVAPWDVYDSWPAEQRIGAYRANCVKYALRMDSKDSRLLNAKKLAHYAVKLVEVLEELEG